MPVAVTFGNKMQVIGFDINQERIQGLKSGQDRTGEVLAVEPKQTKILFTTDIAHPEKANFHIVAVPMPIDEVNQPDLTPMFKVSASVGKPLKRGDIVVYESMIYPGATEEDCVPIP